MMVRRLEVNGEKKILWWIVGIAVTIIASGSITAAAAAGWVAKDYLEFKQTSSKRWEREARGDSRRDAWIRWQGAVLEALAKEHGIKVPPQPDPEPEPDRTTQ